MQLDRSHATSNARAKQAVQDYMHEKKIASKRGPEAVVRLHGTHHSRRSAARKRDHKLRETSRDEKKKGETRSGPCPRRDPPYNRGSTVSTDKALAQHFTNNSHSYTQTTGACNDICVGQLTRYSEAPLPDVHGAPQLRYNLFLYYYMYFCSNVAVHVHIYEYICPQHYKKKKRNLRNTFVLALTLL